MSAQGSFDRTHGRLRIVSAGIFNQYKVVVEGAEIHGTFGGDVLNSLSRGEYTYYQLIQPGFKEQPAPLPPGLTAEGFSSRLRASAPVRKPTRPPQTPPAATA